MAASVLVGFPCEHVAGWELLLLSLTTEYLSYHVSPAQEKIKIQNLKYVFHLMHTVLHHQKV